MPLNPGDRLGPHEILGPLGTGGAGEVYLACDTRLDRRVALKVLPSAMTQDADAITRFRREAFTLASLNHPNIATIYGFEELPDGSTALVMEVVEGETLSARIERAPMPVEEALQVSSQVAEALEVAHERGIVHRDVKPSNVMIGARGLVKVLDFGIAHRAVGTNSGESLDGSLAGTPGYMSPEQALGEPTDGRSDVFAFGSMLVHLLTGHPAFAGSTEDEVLYATLSSEAQLADLPHNVPARVRALVRSCLEKEPHSRPADMRAVRIQLEEALGIRHAAALREGTSYTTPNNLPAPATSFIGRQSVLRESETLLEHSRLLTLLGMGGSGKTRVAQRLAETSLDRFPDGAWFIDLTAVTDSSRAADVAAGALGVPEEPGRTALESLVRHVGVRRMFFIVDNCEHVLDGARAMIRSLLASCPESRIVATSRVPLAVEGEAVFPMPTLALPQPSASDIASLREVESVRLFVERARAAQPDFDLTHTNANDVGEICRRLDGIPLALELAAARVRMLGVDQIRARLGDRFKLLARPGATGPSRQQTVLATIQWSWDHLLEPEQTLMRRLAVFVGGWTLERATAVVSDSGDDFEVLDLLTRLVERSLVVVERHASLPMRYRFLESVWQFARERLETHDDYALMRERHLAAYETLATSAQVAMTGPEMGQQITALKPEEENVLAALAWCDHAPDGAHRGLAIVNRLNRFWSVLGRHARGHSICEEALRRDGANAPSVERAYVLMRFAGFAMLSGDHEAARVSLEEALAFWRSSENPAGLPAVLAGLATVALYQSRFEDSFRLGEESLELYEQRGQRRGVAMILHNLATIEWVLARPDHGRARFERARSILAEIGDRSTEALCLSSLASSRLRCGDLPGAREALRDAFDRLAQIEAPREGIYALDALSELLFMEGRAPESARFAGAAEAARNVLRMPASASERIEIDKVSARVRAELAVEVFERATASGRTLSLEAALTEGRALAASLGSGVT